MKVKTKLCAAVLAMALGCGVIAGCNANGGSKNPSSGGQPDSSQQEDTKYLVNVSQSSDYTVAGINTEGYAAGAKVSFTVTPASGKEIVSVGYDQVDITAKADGSYEFNMPEKNVTLIVSVKAIETYALTHTGSVQIDGDPITFTLKLGNDPVTGYRLEEAAGADKVDIDGVQVTGKEAGETTIIAYIGNEEKARETITVEASAYMTIGDAIADAWANTTNFSDNSKSTKTTNKYKMRAKVVFMGNVYSGKVEMLLDDGTGILDYQISSSSNITAFKVGDVIEVEEVLQNYYGLIEIFSSDVKYAKKVEGVTIPETAFQDATTGAKFDAIYNANIVNSGTHKVVPVNLQAKGKNVDGKNRYEVPGATKGLLATTKSVINLEFAEGATYNFKGYLLNWNDSSKYSNFIAIEQTKLAANSVQINESDFELALTGSNTKQLTYTTDPVGAGVSVAWTVAPAGVVTVSDSGLVTAVAAGNAVITLTVDGKTDTVNVSVVDRISPATAVLLDKESLALETGAKAELNATVTPADTTDEAVWSVLPEGVVTLAQDAANKGKVEVTAVAAGSATITVKYNNNVSASCPVTVTAKHGTVETDPLTAAEAFEIGKALKGQNSQSVYTEDTYYVKAIYTGTAVPSSQKISNDSSLDGKVGLYNTKITDTVATKFEKGAEVMVKGQICNYSNGYKIQFASQAEVIAADNSKATIVEISGDSSVAAGSTITLTANVFPASLNAAATFTSENPDIATVTAAGVVTGVKAGSATIKAQYGNVSDTFLVTVTSASAVTITKTTNQLVTDNNWTVSSQGSEVCYTSFKLDDNITVSTNGSANCGSVWGSTTKDWRLYQNKNGDVVLTAATGYKLVSATFIYTNSNDGILKYGDVVLTSGNPVELSGSTATLVVANSGTKTNGQIRITSFSVTYEAI
ncbi:MAG: Ig-like domain-containing protein [Bacilli bacterium]|nr:Ig-like domain-containing protein [Bacilli bacterium]